MHEKLVKDPKQKRSCILRDQKCILNFIIYKDKGPLTR